MSYAKRRLDEALCERYPEPPEPNVEFKTDFGQNGPQPGTLAYTAFLMAQLDPQDDDPDFWDRWKDEMKENDDN